ncbi:hypothetical protein QP794_01685 [Paenibacillus sp. UMB7766-LJ446]|uniref:hypothetical protein n=1 Tax=Paenibacillus sp. UMB7766-LJ446 TaxID=3046313 RepID=UPI00255172FE|nr:hypothetical protein [Paenibacillus sp. UMB7766-LJ446]MDK8188793.1 hypothetical protein [Paenibacillus sp. UMB7766-LJ446]
MNSKSKVQNPLTIIAIFAGIAELAGTTVLLGLPIEIQRVFVWFVMGFPVGLVFTFFLVLVLKHEVLYAPSDFTDENHFIGLWKKRKDIDTELNETTTLLEQMKELTKTTTENSTDEKIKELKDKLDEALEKIEIAKMNNESDSHGRPSTIRRSMSYALVSEQVEKIVLSVIRRSDNGLARKHIIQDTGLNPSYVTLSLDSLMDKNLVSKYKDNYVYIGS